LNALPFDRQPFKLFGCASEGVGRQHSNAQFLPESLQTLGNTRQQHTIARQGPGKIQEQSGLNTRGSLPGTSTRIPVSFSSVAVAPLLFGVVT
jgi:hypothetical protein